MPRLMDTGPWSSSEASAASRTAAHMRCATASTMRCDEMPRRHTMNSSPPTRPTRSSSRTALTTPATDSTITRSPATWP